MTDNEIINALECCMGCLCTECPYYDESADLEDRDCMGVLVVNALKLINRQKAEINRLKKYDEERDIRLHARLTATARAEAIKEFAEKLKEHYFWNLERAAIFEEDIDNFVKEMTEGATK